MKNDFNLIIIYIILFYLLVCNIYSFRCRDKIITTIETMTTSILNLNDLYIKKE